MTDGTEDASGNGNSSGDERQRCSEPGCERPAAVLLYVPWDEDRAVCAAHARVLARKDGVVAEPIEGAEDEWP